MKTIFVIIGAALLSFSAFSQNYYLDDSKAKAIEDLIAKGYLRFDYQAEKAFVHPTVWSSYTIEGKETFTQYCALYIRRKQRKFDQFPTVDLFDNHSGKKIASFGNFTGFKVY